MRMIHMPRFFISIVVGVALLVLAEMSGLAAAVTSSKPTITSIQIEDGNIVIRGSEAFTYTMYNADPYRATIEIPGMVLGTTTNRIVSDKAGIREIISTQLDLPSPMTKIDLMLQRPSQLKPSYAAGVLSIAVERAADDHVVEDRSETPARDVAQATASDKPVTRLAVLQGRPAVATAVEQSGPQAARATEINGLEVKKIGSSLKVMITGNGTLIPNVFPINERIVIDIPEVAMKAAIPGGMVDPLKSIRAGKHKDKLRLVLDLREKTNFDVTAIGNAIEISLMAPEPSARTVAYAEPKPAEAVAQTPAAVPVVPNGSAPPSLTADGEFSGKKISLDFQDADIVPIFRLLSEIGGYNLVVHPDVKGKITLKLINVPWDQAMNMVLKTFSLSSKIDGNVIRIAPNSVLEKELKDALEAKKIASEVGDLKTRIYPVNYADLSKLKDAIDKAKIVSSRGSVTLDERGSSIIVNDLEQNHLKIDALVKELDQEYMQARQVMIHARIVEVSSVYAKDIGIEWGFFYQNPRLRSAPGDALTFGNAGRFGSSAIPSFLVNLPAASSMGQIGIGYLNAAQTLALDLRLSAMEQLQRGKIISEPRIMTVNNQEAKIETGSSIFLETTVAGATTPSFTEVKATLSMAVKPRIAPGGGVFMDLKITKDEPGPTILDNVTILKNTADTSVLVHDSETVVIGGVFRKSETGVDSGIPGLSKLPILGLLFKKSADTIDERELLIFVTPKIVDVRAVQ